MGVGVMVAGGSVSVGAMVGGGGVGVGAIIAGGSVGVGAMVAGVRVAVGERTVPDLLTSSASDVGARTVARIDSRSAAPVLVGENVVANWVVG